MKRKMYANEIFFISDQGDYKVTIRNGQYVNSTIAFNVCEKSFRKCGSYNDYANIQFSPNNCSHMSTDNIKNIKVTLLDDEDAEKGMILGFKSNETCAQ